MQQSTSDSIHDLQYLMINSVDATSIWIFSALDMLMSQNKQNSSLFCQLFEKKQQVLQLVKSNKIDSKKYKILVGKTYKQANLQLKKCAEKDLLQIKDIKSDQQVNIWFKLRIDETKKLYQEQQKLYHSYKKTIVSPVLQVKPSINTEIKKQANQAQQVCQKLNFRPEQIMSLKIADNMLQKYEQNRTVYQKIYQQKQKILSKKLTAEKYKSLLQNFAAKTTNQDLKFDLKLELDSIDDFHDGNIANWYKEILEETQQNLSQQKKTLAKLQAGPAKKQTHKQNTLSIEINQQNQQQKSALKPSLNLSQINSFKLLDDYLEQFREDLPKYKQLLTKKIDLLNSQKKGSLTAQKYKKLLQKQIERSKDQSIRQQIQFQLSQIDLYDGNTQKWFTQIISSAKLFLEDQEEHLNQLEKTQKSVKNVVKEAQTKPKYQKSDLKQQKVQQINKKTVIATQKSQPNVLSDFKNLLSLKALDEFMQKQTNKQAFCSLFQKKQAVFEMIKKRQLTAKKYKEYHQNILKTTQNQQLKNIVQMSLLNLRQISNNDIDQWFKDEVDQSGQSYQDQKNTYHKYKAAITNKTKTAQDNSIQSQVRNQQSTSKVTITQKPEIKDVICITAIQQLFTYTVQRKDIVYYNDLRVKRQKLIDLISQNKLTVSKYREINQAAAKKTQNLFLKTAITSEQKKLQTQYKQNQEQWYKFLFKKLSAPPPSIQLPQNTQMKRLKSAPAHKKIDYLIRAMSIYESLLYYYRKNKLPVEQNRYLVEYEKHKKKEAVHSFQLIQADQTFDVYNLSLQMFPQINIDIFYGDNLQNYKNKALLFIQILDKEIASLKSYISSCKKSCNSQNIQTAKKQINKCKQNIDYLKTWPNGLTAFPLIKEQKVQKYNMDFFNHLDKNQLQISILNIEGLNSELALNIYIANKPEQRFSSNVRNGAQNIKFTCKVTQDQIKQICKGTENYLVLKFFKRGFFGGLTLLHQKPIPTRFTLSNIINQKTQVEGINIQYVLKVQRPTKPIVKQQIRHIDMTIIPKYKHEKFVQQELIKKYIMYSNPTQSEIRIANKQKK